MLHWRFFPLFFPVFLHWQKQEVFFQIVMYLKRLYLCLLYYMFKEMFNRHIFSISRESPTFGVSLSRLEHNRRLMACAKLKAARVSIDGNLTRASIAKKLQLAPVYSGWNQGVGSSPVVQVSRNVELHRLLVCTRHFAAVQLAYFSRRESREEVRISYSLTGLEL